MDGLTNFIELIIKRKDSEPIPWKTLEAAYVNMWAPLDGGGGKKGGGNGKKQQDYDYYAKWKEMKLEKYAGLFSALASMSESGRKQLGVDLGLEDTWKLETFLVMAGLHRYFPLFKEGITKQIVETEIKFLKSSFPKEASNFENIEKRIGDLVLEGESFEHNFEKLSSVLFVVQELEQCNTTAAETLKAMTDVEQAAFAKCVEPKLANSQNIAKTLHGFAEYKFRKISKENIKKVAKHELEVHELNEDIALFEAHKLDRVSLQTQFWHDYLIANDIFWNDSFLHEEIEHWLSILKQSFPIYRGVITIIGKILDSADGYDTLKIPLTNYFNESDLKQVDLQKLKDLMIKFPGDYSNLKQSDIEYEIDAYKGLVQFEDSKHPEIDNIKTNDASAAAKYPFFTASRFILKSTPKLDPTKVLPDPSLENLKLNLKSIYKNEKLTDSIMYRLIVLKDIYFAVDQNEKQKTSKFYDKALKPYFQKWYTYLIITGMQDGLVWINFDNFHSKISVDIEDINACNNEPISSACSIVQHKTNDLHNYDKYEKMFTIKDNKTTNSTLLSTRFKRFKSTLQLFAASNNVQSQSSAWTQIQEFNLELAKTDVNNEISCVLTKLKQDINELLSKTDPNGRPFPISESDTKAVEDLIEQISQVDVEPDESKDVDISEIKALTALTESQKREINTSLNVLIEALWQIYNVSNKYYTRLKNKKQASDALSTYFVHMYNYFLELPSTVKTNEEFTQIQIDSTDYFNFNFDLIEKCIEDPSDKKCVPPPQSLTQREEYFHNSVSWVLQNNHNFNDSDFKNIQTLKEQHQGFNADLQKFQNLETSLAAVINLNSSNVDNIILDLKRNLFLKCQEEARALVETDPSKASKLFTSAKKLSEA